jgi:hypothetical protein
MTEKTPDELKAKFVQMLADLSPEALLSQFEYSRNHHGERMLVKAELLKRMGKGADVAN